MGTPDAEEGKIFAVRWAARGVDVGVIDSERDVSERTSRCVDVPVGCESENESSLASAVDPPLFVRTCA